MDPVSVPLLVLAGFAAGLAGSIGGLASLFSYPALLAAGLPPLAANVTNTVALFSTTIGATAGSRTELRGQGRRLFRLAVLAVLGGSLGAALLLGTPSSTFEVVVPWLIALGSVVLLAREPIRRFASGRARRQKGGRLGQVLVACAIVLVSVYAGYFGAAAGVLMLAVLSATADEPLPVVNAVKNVVTGMANLTAAVAYTFLAPVHWAAAAVLATGCLAGSWLGPALVRRLPERPLRIGIALGGLGLATHLWLAAAT